MRNSKLISAFTLMLSLMLSGCSGGGANLSASTTTMGQELQDLKASYEKGIISEKEYERAKEDILKRYE